MYARCSKCVRQNLKLVRFAQQCETDRVCINNNWSSGNRTVAVKQQKRSEIEYFGNIQVGHSLDFYRMPNIGCKRPDCVRLWVICDYYTCYVIKFMFSLCDLSLALVPGIQTHGRCAWISVRIHSCIYLKMQCAHNTHSRHRHAFEQLLYW